MMIDTGKRDRILARVKAAPAIMGILNLTPDSFSDGGWHSSGDAAVAHARRMIEAGADIIDVGGESTRPGARPVPEPEELARVLPVIRQLTDLFDQPVSIDTFKASVARAGVGAGAVIINDVTGLRGDAAMAETVAETGAAVVITYNRGAADAMIDVVSDMQAFFHTAFEAAAGAGIPRERIWLDPGVGFAKTQQQNLDVIANIDRLLAHGCPVLAGLSRKSFIAHLTGRPVTERLAGTIAANLIAVYRGARILRVHDVAENFDALRLYSAIEGSRNED